MEWMPLRRGSRPRTTRTNPHMQLEQNTSADLWKQLAERAFALEDVVERASVVSIPGARALWLRDDVSPGPADAFMIGREFAHLHPLPEGSLHMALPPAIARAAVARGWAEPHPMAQLGYVPEHVVMVYGPRDADELEVVWRLVEASHRHARSAVHRDG